jgi:nucleoside-diphosphate-sugar epimerase
LGAGFMDGDASIPASMSGATMALRTPPSVLVAGFGDVGGRLAALRVARGDGVLALRRRDVPEVRGVRAFRGDLTSGEGLPQLPRQVEAIVFCAAPDQRDEAAYRRLYLDGLRRLLDTVDTPRCIFVSSTAVYGEDAGEWVDEATPAQPSGFNGRVLLEAEHVLAPQAGGCVLRLSGLYGPGREALLRRARSREPAARRWTNRLHVDDAAAALSHLLDLPEPGLVYLGNDDRPALETEVVAWIREHEALSAIADADGPRPDAAFRTRISAPAAGRRAYPITAPATVRCLPGPAYSRLTRGVRRPGATINGSPP